MKFKLDPETIAAAIYANTAMVWSLCLRYPGPIYEAFQTPPAIGDLVIVGSTLIRKDFVRIVGYLCEVEPGRSIYHTKYTIECLDGIKRTWENVELRRVLLEYVYNGI
jgi:hypothetical protein